MKRDMQKELLSLVAAVFVDVMLPHAQSAFEDAYRGMERANWRASTIEAARKRGRTPFSNVGLATFGHLN